MTTPHNSDKMLCGPITNSRKKAELTEIAGALGLDFVQKTTVKELVALIKTHLNNHPTLANQRRFQGLFSYRSQDVGGTTAAARTSADKATEDSAESNKHTKDPTGAHKILLDSNIPHDPPARTTRLNSGIKPAPAVLVGESTVTSATTESGTSSGINTGLTTPFDLGDDGSGALSADDEDKSAGHPRKESVIVLLEQQGGLHSKPEVEEVHIPDDAGLKVEHRAHGGQMAAFARLSQLVPIAVANASTPTRKKGGRLSRPGFTGDGARVPIGSIEAVLDANAEPGRYLKSAKVDSYRLDRVDEDTLVCRLFVEPDESGGRPAKSSKVC